MLQRNVGGIAAAAARKLLFAVIRGRQTKTTQRTEGYKWREWDNTAGARLRNRDAFVTSST